MKNEVIKARILYLDQELSFSPLILTQTVHYSEKVARVQWEIHIQAPNSASSRPETEDIRTAQGIRMWRCPCWQCTSWCLTWKWPMMHLLFQSEGITQVPLSVMQAPLLTPFLSVLFALIETVIYWSTRRVKSQPALWSELRKELDSLPSQHSLETRSSPQAGIQVYVFAFVSAEQGLEYPSSTSQVGTSTPSLQVIL